MATEQRQPTSHLLFRENCAWRAETVAHPWGRGNSAAELSEEGLAQGLASSLLEVAPNGPLRNVAIVIDLAVNPRDVPSLATTKSGVAEYRVGSTTEGIL